MMTACPKLPRPAAYVALIAVLSCAIGTGLSAQPAKEADDRGDRAARQVLAQRANGESGIADVLPDEMALDKSWLKKIENEKPDLLAKGLLDVTLYDGWQGNPVDPTGRKDSTKALQKAVVDARDAALAAFFPEGTYLLSDTLNCMKKGFGFNIPTKGPNKGVRSLATHEKRRVIVLIGSAKGRRPVLRLCDNAPGFDRKDNPKPVVIVWNQIRPDQAIIPCAEARDGHGNGFNMEFRGIDIEVGKGNPGAVGLCMTGAQGTSIENCRIDATGGFAGLYCIPGAGAGAANIEVIGGDYGLYGANSPGGCVVAGIFRDQAVRSIHSYSGNHLGFIGCKFIKKDAPILASQECDWTAVAGSVFFKDCSIEIMGEGREAAIDNRLGKGVYLKDVYVKSAGHVVSDGKQMQVPCKSEWTHVIEYASLLSPDNPHKSDMIVNGQARTEPWIEVARTPAPPPPDLLSRHIWDRLPSFEDADAKNVKDPDIGAKGDGVADDTQALLKAIGTHKKVFLPKGTYRISGALTLKKDSVFFGSAKAHAIITNDENWHPAEETPMIATVDDPNATTFLGNIQFNLNQQTPENDKVTMLHWRAGRNSMVKSLQDWKNPFEKKGKQAARFYRISGNGGGRWYFWTCYQGHYRSPDTSPQLRYMLIENTREPLSFYAFNPEHNGATPVEIRNAKNIDILNTKVEQTHCSMEIFDSENISIIGFGGHPKSQPGRGVIEINNSNKITLWCVGGSAFKAGQTNNFYSLIERRGDNLTRSMNAISLYKRY